MESCSFELSFELGLCWSIAYREGEVTLRAICDCPWNFLSFWNLKSAGASRGM